jgi:hypothetical protein
MVKDIEHVPNTEGVVVMVGKRRKRRALWNRGKGFDRGVFGRQRRRW